MIKHHARPFLHVSQTGLTGLLLHETIPTPLLFVRLGETPRAVTSEFREKIVLSGGDFFVYKLMTNLLPYFVGSSSSYSILVERRESTSATTKEDEGEEGKNRFNLRPRFDDKVEGSRSDGEAVCESGFCLTHVEEGLAMRVGDLRGGKRGRFRGLKVLRVTN